MADSEHITTMVKYSPAITFTEGAAGTGDTLAGAALDTSGFEHVCMILAVGTVAANATIAIKAEQSANSDMSDPDDITGSAIAISAGASNSDKMHYLDILRPDKRYVRISVTRAIGNTTCIAWYEQYGARNKPVTQPATTSGERHKDPIAGTA
jgi:hypothetical protein